MGELLYFDCNASFGHFPKKPREARWSRRHLLDDLDLAGIAGAVVCHQYARHYDPMLGNLRLINEIAEDRERLFPCWMAMPSFGPEFPPVSDFCARMDEHDVRAVRLEPAQFGIPIQEYLWAELREALLERRALCLIPVPAYCGDLDIVDRMLDIFKYNRTVLMDHGWSQWREVVALMDKHPHLHLEFSHFQANRAVEFFARRFGPERCLFGTGLPNRAPGAARGFLDYSLLSTDSVSLIAGGNLRHLLGNVGPSTIPPPGDWHDSITAAARDGKPIPCPVYDDHCHICHPGGHTVGKTVVTLHGDADGMIELTRRAGIDKTAIMSWAGPLCCDSDAGNTIVEDAVRKYPDEFIGLATINPDYDDEEKIDWTIQKYHGELGFPGLKTFTPCQTVDYDDPRFAKWLQFGNDHHLYLVLDPKGGTGADRCVRNVAERYPQLGIHLDHCGRGWEYAKWVAGLIKEYANIWGQLNYTLVTNGLIEFMAAEAGADRLLFGTDAPMRDPRPQVTWLAFTRLDEEAKKKIYGGNFAQILRNAGLDLQPEHHVRP